MTNYVYHIARDGQGIKMASALQEFLGVGLSVTECLELTTERPAVANVIESLFGVTPELRFDEYMGEIVERRIDELAADQAAVAESVPDPTFEEVQADIAAMLKCPECGLLFFPDRDNQTYCDKKCSKKASNRKYLAKKANGNGHNVDGQAPVDVAAPIAVMDAPIVEQPAAEEPAADVVANQTLRWLIASNGKELESVQSLLATGKLALGERLHHKTKGWFEVFQNEAGGVDVRKIEGAE